MARVVCSGPIELHTQSIVSHGQQKHVPRANGQRDKEEREARVGRKVCKRAKEREDGAGRAQTRHVAQHNEPRESVEKHRKRNRAERRNGGAVKVHFQKVLGANPLGQRAAKLVQNKHVDAQVPNLLVAEGRPQHLPLVELRVLVQQSVAVELAPKAARRLPRQKHRNIRTNQPIDDVLRVPLDDVGAGDLEQVRQHKVVESTHARGEKKRHLEVLEKTAAAAAATATRSALVSQIPKRGVRSSSTSKGRGEK